MPGDICESTLHARHHVLAPVQYEASVLNGTGDSLTYLTVACPYRIDRRIFDAEGDGRESGTDHTAHEFRFSTQVDVRPGTKRKRLFLRVLRMSQDSQSLGRNVRVCEQGIHRIAFSTACLAAFSDPNEEQRNCKGKPRVKESGQCIG